MTLRNRLREIRLKKNLNQQQLAELAGASQQTISDIEMERRMPSIYTVMQLSKALGVSVETLFYWEE